MEQKYTTAKTLQDTRSYHNFTAISNTKIRPKVVSEQLNIHLSLIFKLMRLLKNDCL